MQHTIDGLPDYGELTVELGSDEVLLVEKGSMSRMSGHLTVRNRIIGGAVRGMFRKMFGGESFFVGEYRHPEGGTVSVAPAAPGAVLHRRLDDETLLLTAGSFLACTPGIKLRTRFGGFKAFFSREGAFVLECSGAGDLFYNAYGGVVEKQVTDEFVVDNGHVVAWEPTLDYSIGRMGGLKSTLFSGEGLIMRFNGHGKLYLQTRTLPTLAEWLTPHLGR